MTKRTSLRILLYSCLVSLVASGSFAAYLESDFGGGVPPPGPEPPWHPRPRPPVPPIIVPPPPEPPIIVPPWPPEPDRGLVRFARALSVGASVAYGDLTVFPLFHPEGHRHRGYRDMEEALRRGELDIRERGRGIVSELLATNHSSRFILLLAGEILMGGKQNRILRRDVLLAPHSSEVLIPAYCVERTRWSPSGADVFRGAGHLGASSLRRSAMEQSSQATVWEHVEGLADRYSYVSPTEDLSGLYRSEVVEGRVDYYRRGFRGLLRGDPVGVVVCGRGRILGAEFFCDNHLFRDSWPRVLSSYVVDLDGRIEHGWPGREWPDHGAVEHFLSRIAGAGQSPEWGPGAGVLIRVSGPGIWGTALVYRGEPVHAALFPHSHR